VEPIFYQKKRSINPLQRVAKTKTGTVLHSSERRNAAEYSIMAQEEVNLP
jgi:hypothetical protein